jgi:hypothetical protein
VEPPDDGARRRPAALVFVLIFILTIWNPASLALHAASSVWTIGSRSTVSLIFLGARLAITSVGIAAGMALWLRRPGSLWLAKFSLVLFAIEAVLRLSARVDVGNAPPGTRLPLALFIIVHNAAWFLYLQTSRRVRIFYGASSI